MHNLSFYKRVSALALGALSLTATMLAAPQTTFTGSVTLTADQSYDYFIYDANGGTLQGIKGVGANIPGLATNYVPAGTHNFSETVPYAISSGVATAIGLYSESGVSIAVNQDTYNAALNHESWSQVFSGTSESDVASYLMTGNEDALVAFLKAYSSDFIAFSSDTASSIQGGILHFSNAADGGSINFSTASVGGPTATPEPSSAFLLGGGMSVLALLVTKLRKA